MKPETIQAFQDFNPQLQAELIEKFPELKQYLKTNRPYKFRNSRKSIENTVLADEIMSAVTLPRILDMYGFQLQKDRRIPCMFHNGRDRNFGYNSKLYHCFVCGAKGNSIQFVMNYFGLSYKDSLAKLDNDFKLGLTNTRQTLKQKQLCKQRHLEMERKRLIALEVRAEHLKQVDIFRYLQKAVIKYAPANPDQDSNDWHPVFVYAATHLGELGYWLDENISRMEV